jgi:hypothetical protein
MISASPFGFAGAKVAIFFRTTKHLFVFLSKKGKISSRPSVIAFAIETTILSFQ